MNTKIDFPPGIYIEFQYQNWKGDDHWYRVALESIEFGEYHAAGTSGATGSQWVLHGFCVERDNEPRPDQPRRTFMMKAMKEVQAA